MKLTKIHIGGFRGIRDQLELNVPDGFLIVTGPNGSGKSTLCDALEFALTGELRRQAVDTERQERISDYYWWRGSDRAVDRFVTITFRNNEGREVEVTRDVEGLKSPQSEQELSRLFCDPARAPEDALRRLLSSALIRDEEITRLSVDMPEADRFRFVRAAVGETDLGEYEGRVQHAAELIERQRDRYRAEYEGARSEVRILLGQIAELEADRKLQEDVHIAEEELERLLGQRGDGDLAARGREALAKVRLEGDRLLAAARDMATLGEESLRVASTEYATLRSDMEARRQTLVENLTSVRDEAQRLTRRLEEVGRRESYVTTWAQLLQHGESLGLRDGQCPLCGSTIGADEFKSHIAEARSIVAETSKELAGLVALQQERFVRQRELERDLERVGQEIAIHQEAVQRIAGRRATILESLAREILAPPPDQTATAESLAQAADERRKMASQLEAQLAVLESSHAFERSQELRRRLADLKTRGDTAEAASERALAAHSKAQAAHRALRRLEGEVVDERLAALGPLLEELYLRMRPHSEWPELRYRIRGDVRRFLSLEVGDGLNPKFMFSSGQRRAIGIAFLLAVYLSTSWSSLSTLTLDDPVQHVDDYRALHLVELLASIQRMTRQVICTVEDPALAALMGRRFRGSSNEAGAVVTMQYQPGRGTTIADTRSILPISQRILLSA